MANTSADSSALERLRIQTTCPKCRERYSQPKLLPCNHSVCRDCLALHLKKGVRKGLNYIVTCPACDKEAELPKTGLDSLPTAFFKQHMSEACSRLQKVVEGKGCEECGYSEASLVAFCRDCERVVCSECRAAHQKLKSLSSHTLISIEDFSRELDSTSAEDSASSLRSLASADVMLCSAHHEPLKMYCRTCHSIICHHCTVGEHVQPRHKVELVDDVVQNHRSELEGGVTTIRGHLSEVRKAGLEKVSVQQDIAKQKKELCLIIDSVFQELHQQMEQSKKKLVREAEKKAAEETAKVSQELDRIEQKASELDHLIQACSEALKHTTDQEFMTLRRDLQTRLKEVAVRKQNLFPVATEPPNLFLSVSCSKEIESTCKDLAHNSLVFSRSKSRVQKVRSSTAEVGREVQIMFSALTKNDKPCIEQLELDVRVTVPRFELEVESKVIPTLTLGSYQVNFLPTKKGEHLVYIQVGGEQLANCPYHVAIRSSKLDLGLPEKVLTKKEWAWGIACSSVSRQIYVTENYNHCISIWDKDGKHVKSIGQKGQKPGQILYPTGIAVNKEGEIYVADRGRVQKLSKMGQLLAIYVELDEPHGVTLSSTEERVYVCDSGSQRIMVFDADLKLVESFGELSCSLEPDQAEMGNLESPHSLALDSSDNIYLTDTMSRHIHVYKKNGTHIRSISHPHDEEFAPSGIAIEDEHLYIADRGGNQVVVFTTTGDFVMATGSYGTAEGQFQNPSGVAVDVDGYLYVCDYGNSRVQVF